MQAVTKSYRIQFLTAFAEFKPLIMQNVIITVVGYLAQVPDISRKEWGLRLSQAWGHPDVHLQSLPQLILQTSSIILYFSKTPIKEIVH